MRRSRRSASKDLKTPRQPANPNWVALYKSKHSLLLHPDSVQDLPLSSPTPPNSLPTPLFSLPIPSLFNCFFLFPSFSLPPVRVTLPFVLLVPFPVFILPPPPRGRFFPFLFHPLSKFDLAITGGISLSLVSGDTAVEIKRRSLWTTLSEVMETPISFQGTGTKRSRHLFSVWSLLGELTSLTAYAFIAFNVK